MRNLFLLSILVILFAGSCKEDEPIPQETDFAYQIMIETPTTDDKHVDDFMQIKAIFESQTGQTVHHVNIRIVSLDGNTEIYNKPNEAHVHATNGSFTFEDDFELSNANGVMEHTDWVLEAMVWGEIDGLDEVIQKVQFHVHP